MGRRSNQPYYPTNADDDIPPEQAGIMGTFGVGPNPYEYEGEETTMADKPLGQDVHEAINQISDIDQRIIQLRKQREQVQARIDAGMNEVQRHYNDVLNGPQESDTNVVERPLYNGR